MPDEDSYPPMKTPVALRRPGPPGVRADTAGVAGRRERIPWLLCFLCLLLPSLPAYAIPPGPLKSNGSPARVIAVMLFGLALLGFLTLRRTRNHRTVNPGGDRRTPLLPSADAGLWGGRSAHYRRRLVEASKTRAVINLIADVGVALYVLARVDTARVRTIVLGCLTTGLTFACSVGLLQGLTSLDLRFLFMPPGFVVNLDSDYLALSERMGTVRVLGTAEHAIEFSVLAAVTVPMTIHFARFAANRVVRWAAAVACGVALLSMPAAVSRTGVLTLLACLLVYMFAFKVRQLAVAVVAGGRRNSATPRTSRRRSTPCGGRSPDR